MPHVTVSNTRTNNSDPKQAAEELLGRLSGPTPKLAVVFADSGYDQRALNAALRERLPKDTRLLGATTVLPIDKAGYHPGHVVLATLSGDFEVGLGLGPGLTTDPAGAGARAVTHACQELGVRTSNIDPRRHVGLVIDDGFKLKKEEYLVGMLDVTPTLTLVGGGACHSVFPNGAPEVYVDGEVATDAVAIAVFRVDGPWAALRHHAYLPTGDRVVITKIDETAKCAIELDGKPAAQRYAELADVPLDELESRGTMFTLSTALKVGREYFMRAPWRPLPDGSIMFANMLTENTELEVMKLGAMPQMMDRFFREEVPQRVASPQSILYFECGTRSHLAHATGQTEQLSAAFANAPPGIGMAASFELCNGFQLNSTMTALVFGAADR